MRRGTADVGKTARSNRQNRRSIRLPGYDYSKTGTYFVTICTQNRECLFGTIVDGEMRLNGVGRIVQSVWNGLPEHYPHVALDVMTIMPNHVHAIIVLAPVGGGCRNGCRGGFETRPYRNPAWFAGDCACLENIFGTPHQPNPHHPGNEIMATELLGTHHPQRR